MQRVDFGNEVTEKGSTWHEIYYIILGIHYLTSLIAKFYQELILINLNITHSCYLNFVFEYFFLHRYFHALGELT